MCCSNLLAWLLLETCRPCKTKLFDTRLCTQCAATPEALLGAIAKPDTLSKRKTFGRGRGSTVFSDRFLVRGSIDTFPPKFYTSLFGKEGGGGSDPVRKVFRLKKSVGFCYGPLRAHPAIIGWDSQWPEIGTTYPRTEPVFIMPPGRGRFRFR